MKRSMVVVIISISWAISWAVGWAIGWSIVREIGLGSSYTIGGPIGGFIGGLITGIVGTLLFTLIIRMAQVRFRWYQIILIVILMGIVFAFDWSRGFVVAAPAGEAIKQKSVGPLIGLFGGLIITLFLRWVIPSLKLKHMILIYLGWLIGFYVFGVLVWIVSFNSNQSYVFGPLYGNDPGLGALIYSTVIGAIGGGIAGLIGSSMTFWQIARMEKSTPSN